MREKTPTAAVMQTNFQVFCFHSVVTKQTADEFAGHCYVTKQKTGKFVCITAAVGVFSRNLRDSHQTTRAAVFREEELNARKTSVTDE